MNGDNCGSASSSELLESQTHIWNHMFGFANSMCLKCAVQLNIPDIIHAHARPMTLSSLIQALEIHPTKATHLYRLMRILTHSGFFTLNKEAEIHAEEEEYGYLLTPSCRLLLKDDPASTRSLVLSGLDPILTDPWHSLGRFFKNADDKSVFDTAYKGTNMWECFGKDERLGGLFNDSMAKDSALIGAVVVEECRSVFEGLKSVVDVGGGTGTLARIIARAFPEIEWTVLDLPQVVHDLQGEKNLQFVGGDMFESIPNAEAILLKSILHDWSDEACVKILKECKKAAIPTDDGGGKVIIIDMVVGDHDKSTQSQLSFDMTMMVLLTGRERDEKEWNNIFIDAGFTRYKITNIGLRSVIEVYA